jgi:GNAT superfamily N-acetyltransferase
MTEIQVRPATTLDAAELVDSMAALFVEDAGTRDSTMNVDYPQQYGERGFTELLELPDKLVLVADVDGRVIGHLTGRFDEASAIRMVSVATLASMYVQPTHRGKGVGARLVEMFRGWARDLGAGRVTVTAYASNEEAVRFYQGQGFEPMSTVLEATP